MVNRQVECIVYLFLMTGQSKAEKEALQQIAGFKYLVDAIIHRQSIDSKIALDLLYRKRRQLVSLLSMKFFYELV